MSALIDICGYEIGEERPFFLIAGPCVIESESLALECAGLLKEMCITLDIPFVSVSYTHLTLPTNREV